MTPTPNEQDAMKDIERLIDAHARDARSSIGKPRKSRAALLAAIGKLVSSTQPAQSQDAQPVAPTLERWGRADPDSGLLLQRREDGYWTPWHIADAALRASPTTIPQAGKVLEALTKLPDLIDSYWKLAYAEGKEGRDHDTEDGAAQQCRFEIDEAIALLRSLPQEEAAGQMTQWISVDERMPQPGTECLVYGPHAFFSTDPYVRIDTWDEQYEAPVGFSSVTVPVGLGWADSALEEVTHWMPLPPPPVRSMVRGGDQTNKEER